MHERIAAEERRCLLIDAAFRVIAKRGVAAATTRAITAEAGMPLASLHHVFRSRDEVLAALIEGAASGAVHAARGAMAHDGAHHDGAHHDGARHDGAGDDGAGDDADIETVIRHALSSYLTVVREAPERELAMFELTQFALRTPGLGELAAAQYRSYRGAARLVVDELVSRFGVAVDAEALAAFTVVLTDGIVLAWLVDRDDRAAERSITLAAAAITALIGTSAGVGAGARS